MYNSVAANLKYSDIVFQPCKGIKPEQGCFSLHKTNINKNIKNSLIQINNVPTSCYISYLPNFTSKIKRNCSSDNLDLQEKSGDFKITKIDNITCPACGKKMLTMEKFYKISLELITSKNDEYLNILSKYKKYMRPVEESVFDEIYKLSQNENASKDIRTLLVSLREKKLPVLQEAQMRQVKKMYALSKTLPKDERILLQEKIKKLKYHIRKTNAEAPFRRKILLDGINKINIRNPKQYNKLQQIAKNFPTSSDINSAWIVKYSGKNKRNEDWTSFEIAQRFLSSSVANTDHILAYSIENNHDDISNYIAMHNACNSSKSDKTFLKWINEDKANRLKYLQTYFSQVSGLVYTIQDEKYKKYVSAAKKTIFETTEGKINI